MEPCVRKGKGGGGCPPGVKGEKTQESKRRKVGEGEPVTRIP